MGGQIVLLNTVGVLLRVWNAEDFLKFEWDAGRAEAGQEAGGTP